MSDPQKLILINNIYQALKSRAIQTVLLELGLHFGIHPDSVAGTTRETRLFNLLDMIYAQGRFDELLPYLLKEFPHIEWDNKFDTNQPESQEQSEPSVNEYKSAIHSSGLQTIKLKTLVNDRGYEEWMHEKSGITMIRIPAGMFLYGKDKQRIYLPEYSIGKTPVTNEQFYKFVTLEKNSKPFFPKHWRKGRPRTRELNHPVKNMTWLHAAYYASWAGLHLPNSEQWEKAARGSKGFLFPWGNEWKSMHCNSKESNIATLSNVGQFSPQGDSPYGCVDMLGNVWEWLEDDFQRGNELRGGSWYVNCESLPLFVRTSREPQQFDNQFGIRVVMK